MFTAQGGDGTGDPIAEPIAILGSEGNDRIGGGDGPDEIGAGPNRDTVNSHASNDDVIGGDGADRLRGGGGHDRLFAEGGKRDGRIDCGPGAADGTTRDAKGPAPISC